MTLPAAPETESPLRSDKLQGIIKLKASFHQKSIFWVGQFATVFDHSGWYADSDGTCRDFICHNGSGADNRSLPNSGAVKDNDPNTKPGFIADANAAFGL